MNKRPKVVIIGAGFGGLNAALKLRCEPIDIVIIDKTNHHLFQPLLYQVASAALSGADIATPIREIFHSYNNVSVIMSEVVSIDKSANLIHLTHTDPIHFDYLIVAVGARHSYFGNKHWEEAAPGIKTLQEALSLREEILMSFEIAERSSKLSEIERYLNFVIVGGGPTGVELAGAIAEIAYKTMIKDFNRIDITKTKVFLIEAAPQILPGFHPKLCAVAKKDLEKLGVIVLTSTKVLEVTDEGVEAEGLCIPTKNVIWAAGNQASPLLKTLDVPLDRQGRVLVEKDLSIPGHSNIFVIGDAAGVIGKHGKPIPAVAPAAVQEGKYVAKIIKKNFSKEKRPPFAYFDKGTMATIGLYKAIASIGPFTFSGFFAWLAWGGIHIAYLISYRNRFIVTLRWLMWLITGKRASRLITGPLHESESVKVHSPTKWN
ncbi:MAG: NAD(P)/FAD-dependent oxidoreductase [Chlamydiales bacterium]|nr:NAD(P)/FAD-dependent oxidoreductase [Chlamydiales bacterium]